MFIFYCIQYKILPFGLKHSNYQKSKVIYKTYQTKIYNFNRYWQ